MSEMHSNWLTQFKQQNPEYCNVNADVLQQSLRHVDEAFNKFFTSNAGFPNFKQHKNVGFEFKPGTVKINGQCITFPSLGAMRFFKSRSIPESWEIRTVTIRRDVDGWYVSVLLRDETVPDLVAKNSNECETIQGADVGIKKLVALSDGTMIGNPHFLRNAERRLEIRQRRVSRKLHGSTNRKKAAKRLARTHQKIRRQRQDYQWKAGKRIAENADITVFENLNSKGMKSRCKPKIDPVTGIYVKNGQAASCALNKAISDASWYSLRQKTKHQAAKLGNLVIEVDPKYTSQECPECHHVSEASFRGKLPPENAALVTEIRKSLSVRSAVTPTMQIPTPPLIRRIVVRLSLESIPYWWSARKLRLRRRLQRRKHHLYREMSLRTLALSSTQHRQLLLLLVKSTLPRSKSRTKPQRKVPEVQYTQLTLFDDLDWDAERSTS